MQTYYIAILSAARNALVVQSVSRFDNLFVLNNNKILLETHFVFPNFNGIFHSVLVFLFYYYYFFFRRNASEQYQYLRPIHNDEILIAM